MADEYIRREGAKDALQEKVFHNLTDEFYGAMQVLDELEPADVTPVVHATWYDDGTELGCQCSKCGKTLDDYVRYDMDADIGLVEIPNFCPNCGAKMDREE